MSESQGGAGGGDGSKKGGKKGAAAKKSGGGGARKAAPAVTKPNPAMPTSIESFIGEPPPADASRGAPPNSNVAPNEGGGATNPPRAASNDRADVPRVVHSPPQAEVPGVAAPTGANAKGTAPTPATVGAPAVGRGSAGAPLRVGLVVGREWSFPPKFIEAVDGRDQGVTAELVKLGDEHMDDPCDYALIVDRISHEVPFYRTYLKHAVVQGTTVVNNPFMWSADDKFFGASLITKLGLSSPKTVVLPNKQYIPGIVPSESLRNLKFPIDWTALAEYVGMPCILKDAHGGGWKEVYVCHSLEELLHHYDNSGLLTMIVQEFIEWDQFVRCLCIGQEEILPMKYDPRERRYLVEHDHLAPALGDRIVRDAKTIVRALGYDMNSIEFAVRDGVPYAIDFMNPAPDMDIYSLTPHYFEWAVEKMANMAIRLAKNPRKQAEQLGWTAMFKASRAL